MEEKENRIDHNDEFENTSYEEFEDINDEEVNLDENEIEEETDSKEENTIVNVKVRSGFKISIIVIIIALIAGFFIARYFYLENDSKRITSTSSLKKVIRISELSSYQSVYNGVAKKYENTDDEKPLYCVSYKSKVKMGIDVTEVKINKGSNKTIIVTLPEIKINDYVVDETSLDYIFMDKDEDDQDIYSEALKLCEDDVRAETEKEDNLYRLAKENASNIVKGLIEPLVQQEGYKVVVR